MVFRNQWVKDLIDSSFQDSYNPPHQNGPDCILSTERRKTSKADEPVVIDLNKGDSSYCPTSVVSFLKENADRFPNKVALVTTRTGKEERWTFSEYWKEVCTVAKGFIKLGLNPFTGVGILGFNAPEWFFSHLGAIFAGGLATGIYTTNSPEACYYILNDCSANIVVVEDETQLKKIIKIRDNLPNLKAIIQYTGKPTHPDVLSWEDLLSIGRSVPDTVLQRRIKGLAVNQCCTIIYTSGTTGNPKGVMLHHDNLTYTIRYFINNVWKEIDNLVQVSFLPLSHIAALLGDLYENLAAHGTLYFSPADALKGKLVDHLCYARPNTILGVPRVWEKMYEKISDAEAVMSPIKKSLIIWARREATKYNLKRLNSTSPVSPPIGYRLSKLLVLKKLKKLLGLDRCTTFISGGAPIPHEVLKFFLSLDIVISEAFGMSETSGPHSANTKHVYKLGSIGKTTNFKINDPDENGHGEFLVCGRNIFMGYLNQVEKTDEALTDDGWCHSGDIANKDKGGFVFITGRIKEIIITSGGENIAPVPIEDVIKKELPVISNCMLIGEKRKFLSMLLTLKTEIDLDTLLPTDILTPTAVRWCEDVKSSAKTVSDILRGPDLKVMNAIQDRIDMYNNNIAVSNAQKIQKWVILQRDFSIPGGELGPSLKLKRATANAKYQDIIEQMYDV